MSGGGAQSALMGATGDSELYTPYLEAIGAVQGVSDAVYGSMDWCPITNLDSADEAYEWMMGVTRSGLSDDEQAISDALATAFAEYVNFAQIKDENGNILTLEESSEGTYQSGTYYDYLKGVIEQSLNAFRRDIAVDMTLFIACSELFSAAPANHRALCSLGSLSMSSLNFDLPLTFDGTSKSCISLNTLMMWRFSGGQNSAIISITDAIKPSAAS